MILLCDVDTLQILKTFVNLITTKEKYLQFFSHDEFNKTCILLHV